MKIAVLASSDAAERRLAVSPDMIKKYIALGADICVQQESDGAFTSEALKDAGAEVTASEGDCLKDADIILTVSPLSSEQIAAIPKGAIVLGMLDPSNIKPELEAYNSAELSAFSLELLPRISRAQSMDVLSSQSNLAGYRAVIEAVQVGAKVVPMMMTAAGTVVPAKALVLGAGVAGLQAIATAKRLGAVVSAFDVRPAVKEQVESLGGKFIEVPAEEGADGETSGGYAKEMSDDYKQKQQQLIFDTIIKQDIVITTALIPGKPAPELVTKEMVEAMKPGAVIVDMAAIAGGNCKLTKAGEVTEVGGVTLVGYTDLAGRVGADASSLYAKNLYTFIATLLLNKDGELDPDWDDELVQGTLLTKGGNSVHAFVQS